MFKEDKGSIPETPVEESDKTEADAEERGLVLADEINTLMAKEDLSESEKDALTSKIEQLENLYKSKEQLDREFQDKAVDFIDELFDERASANDVAEGLAGIDTDDAWVIRQALGEADTHSLVLSLAGLDSESAWKARKSWLEDGNQIAVLNSLVGIDSDRAREIREKLINVPNEVGGHLQSKAMSLAGLDSDEAWAYRERLLRENMRGMATSLIGLDTDRAWKIRDGLMTDLNVDTNSIIRSMTGLDSDRAWEMRDIYINNKAHRGRVAISLAGLDSERAWEMRQKLMASGADPNDIAKGLGGLNSPRAWSLRKKMIINPSVNKGAIARGIYGDWTMVAVRKAKEDKEKGGKTK